MGETRREPPLCVQTGLPRRTHTLCRDIDPAVATADAPPVWRTWTGTHSRTPNIHITFFNTTHTPTTCDSKLTHYTTHHTQQNNTHKTKHNTCNTHYQHTTYTQHTQHTTQTPHTQDTQHTTHSHARRITQTQ